MLYDVTGRYQIAREEREREEGECPAMLDTSAGAATDGDLTEEKPLVSSLLQSGPARPSQAATFPGRKIGNLGQF